MNFYVSAGKRIADLLVCIVLLPIFLLILIGVSLAIKLDDKGPVFYNAPRIGKNFIPFKMYKFRSMKVNAPDIRTEDGSTFNSANDPRLTRVGKFIRKTSLDETPQIINVLLGDMSVVGPRPDDLEEAKHYVGNESRKLEVLPGITGYAQAFFRNSIPWKERIKHDIYYVDNISLELDAKIIAKTIVTVFRQDGVFVSKDHSDYPGK